jgi:hypothetical protein
MGDGAQMLGRPPRGSTWPAPLAHGWPLLRPPQAGTRGAPSCSPRPREQKRLLACPCSSWQLSAVANRSIVRGPHSVSRRAKTPGRSRLSAGAAAAAGAGAAAATPGPGILHGRSRLAEEERLAGAIQATRRSRPHQGDGQTLQLRLRGAPGEEPPRAADPAPKDEYATEVAPESLPSSSDGV